MATPASSTITQNPGSIPRNLPRDPSRQEARTAHTRISIRAARQPIFWATLAFSGGICVGRYAWRPPSWWLIAIVAFSAATIFFLRRRPNFAFGLMLTAFALTGAFAFQTRANSHENTPFIAEGNEVLVTAHVIAEGNLQSDGASTAHQQVDLETEQLQSQDQIHCAASTIRLTVYAKGTAAAEDDDSSSQLNAPVSGRMRLFRYGERLRFPASLTVPHNFRNPGAFDYAGYLREQGITALASVKFSDVEFLRGFSGARLGSWRARIRRSIVFRIYRLWPEPLAGLMEAMIIGEKSFLERPQKVDFQRVGTYHMLVVAGLHVGIIAAFVLWFFRVLGFSNIFSRLCATALIFSYAFLTGEGAPVWRAALMFAVYLMTRAFYRNRAMLNALAIAALCLLIADPNALFGASFQMTMLAVAVIAGIAIPLLDQTIEPYLRGLRNLDALAYDRSLPQRVAQFRIDLRLLANRLSRFAPSNVSRAILVLSVRTFFVAVGFCVISGTLQLGLALPMAYYFHRATSIALPTNLVVVPLMQLIIPAAVLAIMLSYFSFWLAKIPAGLAGFALMAVSRTVHWFGKIGLAEVRVVTPPALAIAAFLICIFAALLLVRRRAWYSTVAVALMLTSGLCIWAIKPRPQLSPHVLEITAIDVGQGDSIFVALPNGGTVLIDGGGFPFWMHSQMEIGEDVVSPYLWSRGISRLDAVALTHAHLDHMGGLPAIISNFRPRELWLPEGIPADEIRTLLTTAERFGVQPVFHQAGDEFAFSGAEIRVLAPDPHFPVRVSHRNDESLVLKITYGKTSALLEGDAEKGTEKLISTEDPSADLLKVAHHGSAGSTNSDFLARVHPRFAVISVGERNVYHHPREQVLERLQQAAAATYRTDVNGATTFYLDGESVIPQNLALR